MRNTAGRNYQFKLTRSFLNMIFGFSNLAILYLTFSFLLNKNKRASSLLRNISSNMEKVGNDISAYWFIFPDMSEALTSDVLTEQN